MNKPKKIRTIHHSVRLHFDGFPPEADVHTAIEAWGCNCGPSALAFALQTDLETARRSLPDFDAKRYVSPTMMVEALRWFGVGFTAIKGRLKQDDMVTQDESFVGLRSMRLVRVQWTGPWTAEGSNPKWAYGHTHWVATYCEHDGSDALPAVRVFDVNCGVVDFTTWVGVAKFLASSIRRSDGGWYPTHLIDIGTWLEKHCPRNLGANDEH